MKYRILYNREAILAVPERDFINHLIKNSHTLIDDKDNLIHGIRFGWLIKIEPFDETIYICFIPGGSKEVQQYYGAGRELGDSIIMRQAEIMLYNTPSSDVASFPV